MRSRRSYVKSFLPAFPGPPFQTNGDMMRRFLALALGLLAIISSGCCCGPHWHGHH